MKQSKFFRKIIFVSLIGCCLSVNAQQTKKPNIIVILADDMGYADIGVQGSVTDIKTPNIDSLANAGTRFKNGYVTAPQCSPSRAGLITGRYQQRFGFDEIPTGPLPLDQITLADRLKKVGYRTGMVGKWHLDPNVVTTKWAKIFMPDAVVTNGRLSGVPLAKRIPYLPGNRGFDEFYTGEVNDYYTNFNIEDKTLANEAKMVKPNGFRIDLQTEAAKQFIQRQKAEPFFLYIGYYGPHVPLEATKKYLDRFPENMPTRRRYALAMIAAIDDGVGELCSTLKAMGIDKNTIIIFTSDNGAPLGLTKQDVPINDARGNWDGSLNIPLLGEKGMLSEGGIKVPFIMSGVGIPKGKVFNNAISTLDIVPTCLAVAGSGTDTLLDGTNLLPYLTNKKAANPHESMFWRFWSQTAVRSGNYKFLNAGNAGSYLFDLSKDPEEKNNIIAQQPAIANQLKASLETWTKQLQPVGIPNNNLRDQEVNWYKYYLEKK